MIFTPDIALGRLGEPQSIKLALWHAAYLPLGLGVLHRISRVLDELLPPDDLLAGVSCTRQRLRHQHTSLSKQLAAEQVITGRFKVTMYVSSSSLA